MVDGERETIPNDPDTKQGTLCVQILSSYISL